MSLLSANVFAIIINKQTEQQGDDLIKELDERGSAFRELAERVRVIMGSHGPHSVFIVIPHLISMNESLEKMTASLSSCQSYLSLLKTIIEEDPERQLTSALKPIAMATGNPGETIATGILIGASVSSLGAMGAVDMNFVTFSAVMQDHEDDQMSEFGGKLYESWKEFQKKALLYKDLNNRLKRYIDENGTSDVMKIWGDLQEMKKYIDELVKIAHSLPEGFKLFIKQAFTHYTVVRI